MKLVLLNSKPLAKQAEAPETAAKYAVEQARKDQPGYTFADDFFAAQSVAMTGNRIWMFHYVLRDHEGVKTASATEL